MCFVDATTSYMSARKLMLRAIRSKFRNESHVHGMDFFAAKYRSSEVVALLFHYCRHRICEHIFFSCPHRAPTRDKLAYVIESSNACVCDYIYCLVGEFCSSDVYMSCGGDFVQSNTNAEQWLGDGNVFRIWANCI